MYLNSRSDKKGTKRKNLYLFNFVQSIHLTTKTSLKKSKMQEICILKEVFNPGL